MEEYAQEYGNKKFAEGTVSASSNIAAAMLKAGETLTKIVQYTGLSMYSVRKLAKQLKEGK